MDNILFFDTETTGNTGNDFICQLAYKHHGEEFSELYKPPIPIPPEASAVHHITNKMVADKEVFRESKDYERIKNLFEGAHTIPVAHNAKFDNAMILKEGISIPRFICTLRIARHLDRENKIPRYNLQFLRYYLGIEIEATAHDALGDVKVLAALFERLRDKMIKECGGNEEQALAEMLAISARPSIIPLFSFGKYHGKNVADIARSDPGYLRWLLTEKRKSETDEEDWIYTLGQYVK